MSHYNSAWHLRFKSTVWTRLLDTLKTICKRRQSQKRRLPRDDHQRTSAMGQNNAKIKALTKSELREIKRNVSFSEDEIVDWYSDFCRRSTTMAGNPNCRFLSEEEFVKVYNSVYTTGNGSQFAKHVFRTFDQNGDGMLDFREFLIGMSMSGSSNPKTLMSWAFRLYDVNNTGFIDRSEMTEIVKSVFRLLGPDQLRLNGVEKTPESLADEIFIQMDADRNGKISWQEFYDGASSNPIVIKLLQCQPLNYDDDDSDDGDEVFQS